MIYLLKIFKNIFLAVVLMVLIVIVISIILYDPQDACLDSAYCKEGLPLNIEGEKIIVNEQTCKEYDGIWYPDKKACHFK